MITVTYRCRCFAPGKERLIDVTEREPGEDVVEWMRKVQGVITADHSDVSSALCGALSAEYVKIPVDSHDDAVGVGMRPNTRH